MGGIKSNASFEYMDHNDKIEFVLCFKMIDISCTLQFKFQDKETVDLLKHAVSVWLNGYAYADAQKQKIVLHMHEIMAMVSRPITVQIKSKR